MRDDGSVVGKPYELARAELLDALAQRYGKFPREVEEEGVELLQIMAIVTEGAPEQTDG